MKALIFSRSDTLAPVIERCLASGEFERIVYSPMIDRFVGERIQATITDFAPNIILIDSEYDERDRKKLKHLATLSSADLLQELERLVDEVCDSENIRVMPASLLLMLAAGQGNSRKVPIFYFVEQTSAALTQELLHGGADWVWRGRDTLGGSESRFDALAECIKRMLAEEHLPN